ncbi:MAG: hypothetical protein CMJ81_04620 [Planctomycetaceae bacterium]|nr:hypothetical protein [Planctomycetaceae bacterium]
MRLLGSQTDCLLKGTPFNPLFVMRCNGSSQRQNGFFFQFFSDRRPGRPEISTVAPPWPPYPAHRIAICLSTGSPDTARNQHICGRRHMSPERATWKSVASTLIHKHSLIPGTQAEDSSHGNL